MYLKSRQMLKKKQLWVYCPGGGQTKKKKNIIILLLLLTYSGNNKTLIFHSDNGQIIYVFIMTSVIG